MSGYTKLFSSIIASTIWREDDSTRIVWITMLAMANKNGVVEASVPGLADLSRISVESTRKAILKLESADPDSRTKESEGRRIQQIDGGWLIINHAKYREKMGKEDRAEYMKKYRKDGRDSTRPRTKNGKRIGNSGNSNVTDVRQAEAKADSDSKAQAVLTEAAAALGTGNFQIVWNSLGKPFVSLASWTEKRTKLFKSRSREEFFIENWRAALERMRTSSFCRGEKPREDGMKPWIANVDWFLREGSVVNIIEGKYDDSKQRHPDQRSGAEYDNLFGALDEPETECDASSGGELSECGTLDHPDGSE